MLSQHGFGKAKKKIQSLELYFRVIWRGWECSHSIRSEISIRHGCPDFSQLSQKIFFRSIKRGHIEILEIFDFLCDFKWFLLDFLLVFNRKPIENQVKITKSPKFRIKMSSRFFHRKKQIFEKTKKNMLALYSISESFIAQLLLRRALEKKTLYFSSNFQLIPTFCGYTSVT